MEKEIFETLQGIIKDNISKIKMPPSGPVSSYLPIPILA